MKTQITVDIEVLKKLLSNFNHDFAKQKDYDFYNKALEAIQKVEPNYDPMLE